VFLRPGACHIVARLRRACVIVLVEVLPVVVGPSDLFFPTGLGVLGSARGLATRLPAPIACSCVTQPGRARAGGDNRRDEDDATWPDVHPGGSLAGSAKNTKSSGSRLSLFHIDTLIARRSTLKRASAASPSCESACRIGFRQIKHHAAHKLVRPDLARGRPDRRARPWSRMVSSSG
jgi:hypothetical protein